MKLFKHLLLSCVFTLLAVVPFAHADENQELFQSLFGDAFDAALKSRGGDDNVEVANRLLEATAMEDLTPALKKLLYQKAFEVVEDVLTAQETAEAVLEAQVVAMPDMKLDALEKLVAIQKKQFTRTRGKDKEKIAFKYVDNMAKLAALYKDSGQYKEAKTMYTNASTLARRMDPDLYANLKDKRDELNEFLRLEAKLSSLLKKYEAMPTPESAKEIAMIYLTEMNRPKDALPYIEKSDDADLKMYVPMMLKKTDELKLEESQKLGMWLKQMGDTAPEKGKAKFYAQAVTNLERFLAESENANGIALLKAKVSLKAAEDALEKLGAEDQVEGGYGLAKLRGKKIFIIKQGHFELIGARVKERLVKKGKAIVVFEGYDNEEFKNNADKFDLIIMPFASDRDIVRAGSLLTFSKVPIITFHPKVYKHAGFGSDNGFWGKVLGKGKMAVERKHPLSGRLTGDLELLEDGTDVQGGAVHRAHDELKPVVLAEGTNKDRGVLVGYYEKDSVFKRSSKFLDNTDGKKLPARRVSFSLFSSNNAAEKVTDDAWKLFDAACLWVID